jgi:ferredoxin-NADP reductase/DMSO/TMAO reductase YedYZ heme-binding membrane subunit
MNDLKFYRRIVIANGCIPLLILAWDGWHDQLGANAANRALHITGILSLVFLFLSLLVTPLRTLTGWNSLIAYRRALGLFGFAYAAVHLGIYVIFDRAGNLASTFEEIISRRYLQVGAVAILLMVPLVVTSTNAMIQWIGPRRWKLLHRLSYVVVILGVAHYYLLVKSDVRQPLAFAAVLSPILGFRVFNQYRGRGKQTVSHRMTGTQRSKAAGSGFWKGQLEVVKIFQETHNVKTFRFQPVEGGELPFRFQAGQYLNIQLPIDGTIVRRSYTISSSPTNRSYCEISVKREELGVGSRFLHDEVTEGTILEIAAPAGKFVFDDSRHTAITLIAGGVGITPMMSLARSLTERSWPGEIYFICAVRTPKDIIFREELERLSQRFRNLHLHITLSDPVTDPNWQGATGRITGQFLSQIVPSITGHPVHVCGPGRMMDATCEILRTIGVPDHLICTEAFLSPTGISRPSGIIEATSDNEDVLIESVIEFSKSHVVTTSTSGTSVLEAAEAAGVEIPWECRSGICGQCKVRLRRGSVRMEVEDALSAKEKEAGFILACQAHPKSQLEIEA